MQKSLITWFFILAALYSCNNRESSDQSLFSASTFKISDFIPITNYKPNPDIIALDLDYNNSMENGFVIPGSNSSFGKYFVFTFQIKNTTAQSTRFTYKIYFQNESYKFSELDSASCKEHEFAHENFYGSWEDSRVTFRLSPEIPADGDFHEVRDSFRIVGNPRNEQRYFDQGENQRWKRNPRVGNYSFLLAVWDEKAQIPEFIYDCSKKSGLNFTNPFYYFKHGAGKTKEHI